MNAIVFAITSSATLCVPRSGCKVCALQSVPLYSRSWNFPANCSRAVSAFECELSHAVRIIDRPNLRLNTEEAEVRKHFEKNKRKVNEHLVEQELPALSMIIYRSKRSDQKVSFGCAPKRNLKWKSQMSVTEAQCELPKLHFDVIQQMSSIVQAPHNDTCSSIFSRCAE